MIKKTSSYKKSFTLIEMLIVIVIIGILAVALVPKLLGAQERTRDAVRQIALRDISNAIEAYATDNGGGYPKASFIAQNKTSPLGSIIVFLGKIYHLPTSPLLDIAKVFAADSQSSIETIKESLGSYLSTIPTDPKVGLSTDIGGSCIRAGEYFSYYTDVSGKMYAITALMETQKGNTTNCKGDIDKNGDGEYLVVGKGLNDVFHPATPSGWYDGNGYPFLWCKRNITTTEIDDLNNLIVRFSGIPQQANDRCTLQDFSLKGGTFGITNPTSPDAGQKVEIPSGFNKLVGLRTLDLSAGVINITHLTYPMFYLKSIHLDGNKHLKDLILPTIFPNLEEFILQDSLLSSVTFPQSAPALRKINIYDTNLQRLDLPAELPSLVELRINATKLQTIFLPENIPNIQALDLTNNQFVAPLPASTCTFLKSKGWTSSTYIDNYSKLCNK